MKTLEEQSRVDVLTFEVADRQYGIPASDVQEVLRSVPPIPLPGAPIVVEGIMNLRGKIIPIFNLRARLQLPVRPMQHTDQLIIAWAASRLAALHVDRASELIALSPSDIEEAAAIVPGVEYVAFLAKLPQSLLLIQDLDAFLSRSESAALDEALANSELTGALA